MNIVVIPEDSWKLALAILKGLPNTYDAISTLERASNVGEEFFNRTLNTLQAQLTEAQEKAKKWDALQEELQRIPDGQQP